MLNKDGRVERSLAFFVCLFVFFAIFWKAGTTSRHTAGKLRPRFHPAHGISGIFGRTKSASFLSGKF